MHETTNLYNLGESNVTDDKEDAFEIWVLKYIMHYYQMHCLGSRKSMHLTEYAEGCFKKCTTGRSQCALV